MMKSPQEFRVEVYEKLDQAVKQRKKNLRRALTILPLVLILVIAGSRLPLLFSPNGATKTAVIQEETAMENSDSAARSSSYAMHSLLAAPAPLRDLSWLGVDAQVNKLYSAMNEALAEKDYDSPEAEALMEETDKQAEALYEEASQYNQERRQSAVSAKFTQALNTFARDSSAALAPDMEENSCFSPLSLYLALALAGEGADGETREQFLQVLGAQDPQWLADQCAKYYRQHYQDNEAAQFWLANSLWLDQRGDFQQDYLDTASQDFYASVLAADFTNPLAAQDISDWIYENTNGLLSPQLDIDPQTLMAIVNTLYFHAPWVDEFAPESVTDGEFHTADGSSVTVPFMNRTVTTGSAYLDDRFIRSSLPLSGGAEMIFILPDEGVSTSELLSDPEAFEKMFFPRQWVEDESFHNCQVEWSLPKFSVDSDFDLSSALQSLGLSDAFDSEKADFSPMGRAKDGRSLYLSSVQQGTHIAVDEDGVEAAAYTVAYMTAGAAMPEDDIVRMHLDRPFLFAIVSSDLPEDTETYPNPQSILFVGQVGNPSTGN